MENEANRGKDEKNMGKREMKIDGEKLSRKERKRVYKKERECGKTGERIKM